MTRDYYLKVAEAKAAYAAALRVEADAESMVDHEELAETLRRFASQWDVLAASYRASADQADAA
ncbi:hypothetical protein HH110_08810 [Stenotrophomonas sp. SAM-B]|uniref:hypothetical protein n=1 Tax=Stenotrophomonas sp. SAM-B TaxID=2729141 RepID=UPI0015A23C0B|nr:hypothetical protein [Stenotrophomonas sp. SAM-B]NWF33145.1 hypothetical protein [Stenotrophomonas sp. SAM-B]